MSLLCHGRPNVLDANSLCIYNLFYSPTWGSYWPNYDKFGCIVKTWADCEPDVVRLQQQFDVVWPRNIGLRCPTSLEAGITFRRDFQGRWNSPLFDQLYNDNLWNFLLAAAWKQRVHVQSPDLQTSSQILSHSLPPRSEGKLQFSLDLFLNHAAKHRRSHDCNFLN